MVGFLVPALLGAALGGGGGSSSSSNSASTNTIGFNPTINLFGDIRDTQANTATDANGTSAAVVDNTPGNALDGALLQPSSGAGITGSLTAFEQPSAIPTWMIVAGGAAVLGVGYYLTRG